MALGYPLGQTSAITTTTGVVKERFTDANLGELLQTNASMNPRNSGCWLINLKGKVVGIDQSVRLNPRTGEIAPVGFTLAIDGVRTELKSLEAGTVVEAPKFTNSTRNYYFSYPPTWALNSSNQDDVMVSSAGAAFEVITFLKTPDSYADPGAIWQLIFDDLTSNFPEVSIMVLRSSISSLRTVYLPRWSY